MLSVLDLFPDIRRLFDRNLEISDKKKTMIILLLSVLNLNDKQFYSLCFTANSVQWKRTVPNEKWKAVREP